MATAGNAILADRRHCQPGMPPALADRGLRILWLAPTCLIAGE
jgi:hypothetical protein